MLYHLIYLFAGLAVCFGSYNAKANFSSEEKAAMKEATQQFVKECRKEYKLTLDQSKHMNDITSHEKKFCFMSCVLKKSEILDSQGMFDAEKALEFVKNISNNDETLAVAERVITECSVVNNEEVSDGSEGCERTRLILKCYKDHGLKLVKRKSHHNHDTTTHTSSNYTEPDAEQRTEENGKVNSHEI